MEPPTADNIAKAIIQQMKASGHTLWIDPVTQALLDGIEDAIADNIETAWNNYSAKLATLTAATTVEQVNAVEW